VRVDTRRSHLAYTPGVTTPDDWARRISGPAKLSSDDGPWSTALIRHWRDTSPDMEQPPLDHHYIVQHLGGAKKVHRQKDGASISSIVERGSITIVPVGTEFQWHTEGPIEFAHLYIAPSYLERSARRFGHGRSFSLKDCVGGGHQLLSALFSSMLAEIALGSHANTLYLDCLLENFNFTLLREHSTVPLRDTRPRESLARFRLVRVTDFIESHLTDNIHLRDLVNVSGLSTFHFVRAFKNALGVTPYQFLLRRRIEEAKGLLRTTGIQIEAVATSCGFKDAVHFSKMFHRHVRMTPSQYRRDRS
jgi:AraC family transcriptional regulator